jgi:hypothetical protein
MLEAQNVHNIDLKCVFVGHHQDGVMHIILDLQMDA